MLITLWALPGALALYLVQHQDKMLTSRGCLALYPSYCLAQEHSGSVGLGWAHPTCQGLNILAGEDSGPTKNDLKENSG